MVVNIYNSFGLIGYPLGHSLSPTLHQAGLDALNLRGEYRLYPVEPLPGGEKPLGRILNKVRTGEIKGLNVTIPHKKSVVAFLDKLTPTASEVGAVNTIYQVGNHLIGDNTDVPGFLTDLDRITSEIFPGGLLKSTEVVHNSLILGAGGSARAVFYGLKQQGWSVTVAARHVEQANELIASLPNLASIGRDHTIQLDLHSIQQMRDQYSLLINTTPVGMWPDIEKSPWPKNLRIPTGTVVYDLVYNPTTTKFVRTARDTGNIACGGLGMLVEQAASAFECWTGLPAPRSRMYQAVAMEFSPPQTGKRK
jgi:shikimate dehydrogenase